MKEEMINSIAKEINQHYRTFKEHVLIKVSDENEHVFDLYQGYEQSFFPGTTKKEFAALYSQTIIFSLLSEVLFHIKGAQENELRVILSDIIFCLNRLKGMDPIIKDILESMKTIDIPLESYAFIIEILDKITGCQTGDLKEDDILALIYEQFLKQYEPGIHKKIRYYLTPRPVVSFMVYTLNHLLKEKLNIDEGLAGQDIHILDPSFGTANFMGAVLQLAIEEKTQKYGKGIMISFIESYLLRNIHGFEVMLPLFAMGFIYLRKIIKNFGRGIQGNLWEPMANLFLCDTLKYQEKTSITGTRKSIKVIFCNPPYSRHSLNKGEWITGLVRDYFQVNNRRIEEKNLKGLQDDYVKFFRLAQWSINQNGSGVMGFITSNSYLENPTFRGMRYSLLKSFDEIYILDLHGEARKVEKNADDENIFGIGQGIAIGFFIKRKKIRFTNGIFTGLSCKVFYSGIKGRRESKLEQLEKIKGNNYKSVQWERVSPVEEFYRFAPGKQVDIYRQFIKLTDIFPVHSVGILTARDKLTIKRSAKEVYETISYFSLENEKAVRENYKLGDDSRDWHVKEAQKDIIESGIDRNKIVPILYRPFDIRYTYYTGNSRGFICMPRPGVMRHMLQENIGLISVRQVSSPPGRFTHVLVTDTIIESRVTTCRNGIAYIFPLDIYAFPGKKTRNSNFKFKDIYPGIKYMHRHCNINPDIFKRLQEIFGREKLPSARQIFYYIYAILNSGIYRERYWDHLKIDFPRVPFTGNPGLFMKLSGLGEVLVDIHLMKSPELGYTFSKFEVIGDNLVKKPLFTFTTGGDGRVYINDTQYFSHISKEIWEFEVCGYQVLQKWLKERKNQVLSPEEILHYIKICRAVQLTIDYHRQIYRMYSELEKGL